MKSEYISGFTMLPIPGYEDKYLASSNGRIWSIKSDRWLAGGKSTGYSIVHLEKHAFKVAKLIAMTFLSNLNNWPEAHHKYGKEDNRPESLEWTSNSMHHNGNRYELGDAEQLLSELIAITSQKELIIDNMSAVVKRFKEKWENEITYYAVWS